MRLNDFAVGSKRSNYVSKTFRRRWNEKNLSDKRDECLLRGDIFLFELKTRFTRRTGETLVY